MPLRRLRRKRSERRRRHSKASARERGKTGFTALFIRRPIFALVVNTLIVVAGLAAWNGIEIRELPQVDQPVISVTTTLDGAAPETMDREVTSVVEGRSRACRASATSPRPRPSAAAA